jgi:predicted nucleotidyltransferase component of viral defense system
LLAIKLRALYERKKGRDAFDLWLVINTKDVDAEKTMEIFLDYMAKDN